MKVSCPFCTAAIPARDVNLQSGSGKCEACNEVFPLKDALPGYTEPAPAAAKTSERPFNARAIVQRSADELVVHVPAEGMRAATCGLLGFAIFWLGFVAFWTLGALGVFFGGN